MYTSYHTTQYKSYNSVPRLAIYPLCFGLDTNEDQLHAFLFNKINSISSVFLLMLP